MTFHNHELLKKNKARKQCCIQTFNIISKREKKNSVKHTVKSILQNKVIFLK